jgi:hypothetical protein
MDIPMKNAEPQSPRHTEKVKNLYYAVHQEIREVEYVPYFYAEVRLDFNDVRTGLKETFSLNKALEIYSSTADLLWIKDMVQDVDPEKMVSAAPEGACIAVLPEYVDANFIAQMETQFVQYLLRSFATELYRNSALNVYSNSGEPRSEFIGRCAELLDGPRRRELDLLQDVFKRRLEQLKEKYLVSQESMGLERARIESQNRDIFARYSDRILGLFLVSRFASARSIEPFHNSPGMQELEERLGALGIEARNAIAKLTNSYDDKARALDECLIHPNMKDIHFVRSCILWMPKRAA